MVIMSPGFGQKAREILNSAERRREAVETLGEWMEDALKEGNRPAALAMAAGILALREHGTEIDVSRFIRQYTAKNCPGRPCSDVCDHRGV